MPHQNAHRLLRAFISLRRQMAGLLTTGDLAQGEYLVLLALQRRAQSVNRDDPYFRTSGLSDAVGVSRPNVTRLLNSLEAKGLVSRSMSADDRRVMLVNLTPAGETALAEANSSLLKLGEQLIAGLGEQEADQLIELLCRLSSVSEQVLRERAGAK